MRKKAAIYTLYKGNRNYGGLLQAYALQKKIEEYDYECSLISYTDKRHQNIFNRVFRIGISGVFKICLRKFKNVLCLRKAEYQREEELTINAFQKFEHSIPHTKEFAPANIKECGMDYDVFITGSDQVWSPNCWNDTAFLKFVPKDKIKFSYAASLGSAILSSKEKEFIRNGLRGFDAVSVREKNVQELIQQLTDKKVKDVLDPTLLIEGKEWKQLMEKPERDLSDYAFMYSIGQNKTAKKQIYNFCKKNNMKVVTVTHLQTGYKREDIKYSDIQLYAVSPLQWVWLIAKAKMVFTDSFHGTAFSINLNKKFYCFGETGNKTRIERIESLLKQLGIENRILTQFLVEENEINYEEVNKKLEDLRKKSCDYISCVLKGGK